MCCGQGICCWLRSHPGDSAQHPAGRMPRPSIRYLAGWLVNTAPASWSRWVSSLGPGGRLPAAAAPPACGDSWTLSMGLRLPARNPQRRPLWPIGCGAPLPPPRSVPQSRFRRPSMGLRYAAKNRGMGSFGPVSMGVRHGAEIQGVGSFEKPPLGRPLPLRNSGILGCHPWRPPITAGMRPKTGGWVAWGDPTEPPPRSAALAAA
jgi:hypothetical protein